MRFKRKLGAFLWFTPLVLGMGFLTARALVLAPAATAIFFTGLVYFAVAWYLMTDPN